MLYSCPVTGDANFGSLVIVVLSFHNLIYLFPRNWVFKEDGVIIHFPPLMLFLV